MKNKVETVMFLTYADNNYRDKSQVLIESLIKGGVPSQNIIIVSLDATDLTTGFECVHQINWNQISNTTFEKREDYFKILPSILIYLKSKGFQKILYLDCDVKAYFSRPEELSPILKGSISAVKQNRFGIYNMFGRHSGTYNVGVNYFDFGFEETITIVEEWKNQCLNFRENINKRLGYFSEQILMDNWPDKLTNFNIINETVFNQAIWNTNFVHVKFYNNRYYYKKKKIVFYHFSSIKCSNNFYYFSQRKSITPIWGLMNHLYKDYISLLRQTGCSGPITIGRSFKRIFLGHEFYG